MGIMGVAEGDIVERTKNWVVERAGDDEGGKAKGEGKMTRVDS